MFKKIQISTLIICYKILRAYTTSETLNGFGMNNSEDLAHV